MHHVALCTRYFPGWDEKQPAAENILKYEILPSLSLTKPTATFGL